MCIAFLRPPLAYALFAAAKQRQGTSYSEPPAGGGHRRGHRRGGHAGESNNIGRRGYARRRAHPLRHLRGESNIDGAISGEEKELQQMCVSLSLPSARRSHYATAVTFLGREMGWRKGGETPSLAVNEGGEGDAVGDSQGRNGNKLFRRRSLAPWERLAPEGFLSLHFRTLIMGRRPSAKDEAATRESLHPQ